MSKQIKLSEIKLILGMEDWSNNSFANALCCIMIDSIEYNKSVAKIYAKMDDGVLAQVYNDYAKDMQERKRNLHDRLDSLGYYDDIRK